MYSYTKYNMATDTTSSIGTLDYDEIVFPKLGIDLHLDSTAFSIGSLDIQWYGLLVTLGLALGIIYLLTQVQKYGLNPDRVMDAVIAGIIGGIVGARAYYVIMEWETYAGDWKSIFNIRQGGLAIYGGIIGGLLAGCLVAKLRKVRLLPLLDITGICFLLGQGIGRWGNFFNQEAFGTNTDSIFGMTGGRIQAWITNAYPSTIYYQNFGTELNPSQPVHPCFLYESVWCLLGFVLLALFAKKIRRYDGQIFLMYIGWYGLERAFVEGLRTDSLVIGNLRVSQLIAILCVVISIILQIVIGTRVKRMGSDYKLYKDTAESKQLIEYQYKRIHKKNTVLHDELATVDLDTNLTNPQNTEMVSETQTVSEETNTEASDDKETKTEESTPTEKE